MRIIIAAWPDLRWVDADCFGDQPFPFGQGRDSALASVDELNPALRDTAASVVPCLRNAAMISAGCQSGFLEFMFTFLF